VAKDDSSLENGWGMIKEYKGFADNEEDNTK